MPRYGERQIPISATKRQNLKLKEKKEVGFLPKERIGFWARKNFRKIRKAQIIRYVLLLKGETYFSLPSALEEFVIRSMANIESKSLENN